MKYTKKKKKKSWVIHCRRWILWYVNFISIKLLKNPVNDIVTIVQLLSCVPFFVTPWTTAYQALLYSTVSQSLLKCMSVESVMLSNMSPPSPPAFHISQHQGLFQWVSSTYQRGKYWSFSFSIGPSNKNSGLISFRIDWFDLLVVADYLIFLCKVKILKTFGEASIYFWVGFFCKDDSKRSSFSCWYNFSGVMDGIKVFYFHCLPLRNVSLTTWF